MCMYKYVLCKTQITHVMYVFWGVILKGSRPYMEDKQVCLNKFPRQLIIAYSRTISKKHLSKIIKDL